MWMLCGILTFVVVCIQSHEGVVQKGACRDFGRNSRRNTKKYIVRAYKWVAGGGACLESFLGRSSYLLASYLVSGEVSWAG